MNLESRQSTFLRLKAVPKKYPLSEAWLRKAVFLGRLPVHRVGRSVFLKEEDILDLFERGRAEAASGQSR